jgi:hypothetical protein
MKRRQDPQHVVFPLHPADGAMDLRDFLFGQKMQ